jgi:hypothetical protein
LQEEKRQKRAEARAKKAEETKKALEEAERQSQAESVPPAAEGGESKE